MGCVHNKPVKIHRVNWVHFNYDFSSWFKHSKSIESSLYSCPVIASKVFTSQENCAVVGSANHYGNGPLFKAYCKNTHTVVYLINTSVFILDHQVDTIVRQHHTKIWFYNGCGIFVSLEIIKMFRVWRIINMVLEYVYAPCGGLLLLECTLNIGAIRSPLWTPLSENYIIIAIILVSSYLCCSGVDSDPLVIS